ncbi:hypothetical protein BKA60DRAFT_625190, partial [Fusarium oxysporum]
MVPKTASSCNPKPCILGENPHRRKTQGGQNDALREKTAASFLGLQVSSVPFRPSGLCLCCLEVVRQKCRTRLSPGGSRTCKRKRFSGQYAAAEVGHAASSCERQEALRPVRRGRGDQRAQKVEQLTAAGVVRAARAAKVGRGSVKLQVSVRVRVRRPSMSSGKMPRMSPGQPRLQRSVVREIEGCRARIVEGSRSRN